MNKYIKLEDAIRKYAEMIADEAYWEHGVGNGKPDEEGLDIAREYYSDLPTIEVSEDCISRAYAIEVLSHVKKDEQWRTECIDNEIRLIKLLPSVVPIANKDEWIEEFSDDGWRWVKDES